MAKDQDPRVGSTGWALTSHGISENLFTVDKTGNIVGVVAKSVKKVSEYVWDVTIKSGVKFSDGAAVTSQGVADCLQELNTMNTAAQASVGTMTVTAPSATTVRIESTKATHVMDSVLAEWAFPIYHKKESFGPSGNVSATAFVFTGPYKVDKFVAGDHIDLSPNAHYHDGKASERSHHLTVKKFDGGDALAKGLTAKTVDVAFHLPIGSLADIRKQPGAHVKTFETGYHYMAFHNIQNSKNAALADKNVRQAIDVAIDRAALVTSLDGGKGTRSFFPDYSPFYAVHGSDKGDATTAATQLDAAGWKLVDGKRTKDGQPLTIRVVAYPQRPGLPIMLPVLAKQLETLGITVNQITTSATSWDELDKIMADRSWDILMWAQNTLPAGDPLWFMSHFFRSDGGNNHAKFNSSSVDALLDTLSLQEDHTKRVAASKAAMAAIIAEAPVSNLVTPGWHVGLSDRMVEYEPYGSDYYIINAAFHEVMKTPVTTTTAGVTTTTAASGSTAVGVAGATVLVAAAATLLV